MVVPKKSGNVYVYDSPNQVLQDYDVPPSRRDGNPGGVASNQASSNSSFDSCDALQNYDVPSSLRSTLHSSPRQLDNYDKLPGFARNVSRLEREALSSKTGSSLIYDIPPAFSETELASPSNRSSVLSVLSTGSHSSACSGHSSLGGSASARSSVDVSMHEIYDVPLSSRAMSGSETGRQLQNLAEHGMLDDVGMRSSAQSAASSPFAKTESAKQNCAGPPSSLKLHVDRDSYLDDYSVPRSDVSQGSGDSGISVSNTDPFGSRPCAEELYDTPRKLHEPNQPKSEELAYDVPNRINYHSRDSNSSVGSAALELSLMELSNDSAQISNPPDILIALQSTVLGHSSKLVSLIGRLLSDGGNQGQELSQIKLACLAMKTALKEVIDFGNGGLVQSLDSSNKELSDKVFELLDKVHVQLQYLNRHVEKLLTTVWPPRRHDKAVGGISELDDTLNTIGMLTEAVSGHLQTLTKFVLQNSSSLFRRSAVENGVSGRDLNRAARDDARLRPPLPPATKAKPKLGSQDSIERQLQVQERPLPPVPCQASTISVSKFPRQQSGGVGFQASNSTEWNDDCDYVSIANEAESEMQACEKLLYEQEPDKPVAGYGKHQDLGKEAVCSGDSVPSAVSFEKKAFGPSPIGKVKPPSVPLPTILTNAGVATTLSGNTDRLGSISRAGTHENGHAVECSGLDPQSVAFYADQAETHFTVVDSAVREFFQMSFSDRVTAKEFLLRSKFVILAAHKLVYIGDTVTRNSVESSAQNQVALSANNLCDILKETVAATKTSALNFPQNLTQQKLIDCMKAVLQASLQLCKAIRSIAGQM